MKNKIKVFPIVLFLSIVILFISCGKQKTEWQGTIEEVDGVTVVKNPKEPLFGEIKFELEEDLSIGSEENENFLFYRAGNIAVDKEGNIYVSDGGNRRIQKFDSDGNYLQTIGRKGQGPGEEYIPVLMSAKVLRSELLPSLFSWLSCRGCILRQVLDSHLRNLRQRLGFLDLLVSIFVFGACLFIMISS